MKITFSEDNHGLSITFNTDWTIGKKMLDLMWDEMTIIPFNRQCDKENETFANAFAQIDEMCSHCRGHATIINQDEHIKLCKSCYDKMMKKEKMDKRGKNDGTM